MHAHDRAEGAELEPAHEQFVESRVGDVTAVETANIRSEPGDTRDTHVNAGDDLGAEVPEVEWMSPDQTRAP